MQLQNRISNTSLLPSTTNTTTTTSVLCLLAMLQHGSVRVCVGGQFFLWGGYLWRRAAARGASSRLGRVVGRRLLLDHPRTHPSCPPFRPTGMGGCPYGRGAAVTTDHRCDRRRAGRQRPPDVSDPVPSYWPEMRQMC